MAKIEQPVSSGFRIADLAPLGQYVAVCLRIEDQFGVERTKFQSQEKEQQDVTRFLFGFLDQTGRPHLIQTFEFKISGAPGANLMKFLTSWTGRVPDYGWDYCDLLGTGAMISVAHRVSKSQPPVTYSTVSGIFPVPAQMIQYVPDSNHFNGLIAAATANNPAAPTQSAPPQPHYAPPQAAPPQQAYAPPQQAYAPPAQPQYVAPPQGAPAPMQAPPQAYAPPQQQYAPPQGAVAPPYGAPHHVQHNAPPQQAYVPPQGAPAGFEAGGFESDDDDVPF